jgi:hypothetical protein
MAQPALFDGGPERAAALPQVHARAHALLRHLLRAHVPAQHGERPIPCVHFRQTYTHIHVFVCFSIHPT